MRVKSYYAKSKNKIDGDMFLISHDNGTMSIIDCCINDNTKDHINEDLDSFSNRADIIRFISTHPDEDHISGLAQIDKKYYHNFYCVKNKIKKDNPDEDFIFYEKLRDHNVQGTLLFNIDNSKLIKWLNNEDNSRESSHIRFLWPNVSSQIFIEELKNGEKNGEDNNLCPVIKYDDGNCCIYWFGDLENEFLEKIKNEIKWDKADIIFAPHHGKKSGKIPSDILNALKPKIIVIGNGDSEYIDYYKDYQTITQNSSGDIVFEFRPNYVDIFVEDETYQLKFKVEYNINENNIGNTRYKGSLKLK